MYFHAGTVSTIQVLTLQSLHKYIHLVLRPSVICSCYYMVNKILFNQDTKKPGWFTTYMYSVGIFSVYKNHTRSGIFKDF